MSGVIADTLAAHQVLAVKGALVMCDCRPGWMSRAEHVEHVGAWLYVRGVGDLRGLLAGFSQMADLAARVIEVHEHVAMDTAEDKALHAKACATFGDLHAALVARYTPPAPTEEPA